MLGPAAEVEVIESGKDYSLIDKNNPIFSIHCTKTNECDVSIKTIGGTTAVFPPGAFVQGAVYHFYITKVTFDPKQAGFIGYRTLYIEK